MSVENSEYTEAGEPIHKSVNGDQEQRINGLSNGHVDSSNTSSKHHHHKSSSSKSKHRDRDRDREKDRDHKSSKSGSSSNRDKESSDKHKSSSTSSSKDKHRDKDRDKDKDRHKSSSSSHKSSRDKDRDRDKERIKDKDRSERDKDRQNKDKEKSKENTDHAHSNERREQHSSSASGAVIEGIGGSGVEKKKEHKSSNSSNSHHHRHSSSNKDKDRSSSHAHKDRDRDRHKSSKDKHSSSNHSSSRSKDKHSSSSSSKDKDRHRSDKEKHSSSSTSNNKEVNNSSNMNNHYSNNDNEQQKPRDVLDSGAIPTIKEELKVEQPEMEYNNHHPFRRFHNNFSSGNDNHLMQPSGLEYKHEIKDEPNFNISQASSCDYSMSQFRDDEPNFIAKEEATDDDSQEACDPLSFNAEADEDEDEDDVPLSKRKVVHESEDDVPLINRKKPKFDQSSVKVDKKNKKAKKKKREEMDDEYLDEKPKKKKVKKEKQEIIPVKIVTQQPSPTKGRKKKEEEPEEVWRWWEEEKREDGVKWIYLEHKGPVFAPEYEPLPDNVNFYYDGKRMKLSNDTEEVATFYAKMLNHDYVTKDAFNSNFFKDWRKSMTSKERETIKDLRKCNFQEMHEFFLAESEKRKNRTKQEKQAVKEENERLIQEYGFCIIDGHKERIGNFKLEPPGLFRGRGEHPKMGLVKRRIMPEDVLINCSRDSKIPQPPPGHRWKEVRHDNSVTWLASWTENIQGQVKYIMLNPSSKLKGEKDYQKYETARRLDKHVDKIRATYRDEWKSKEMRIRQRGVALYFIDKLALRAGNEKDEDQADTVGCCSLRVEHVKLFRELNGKENVVVFDFLGKDSIRYYNEVEVEKRVFKNLELFMENKKDGDDLFDRLNTAVLNEHLKELMDGLTAKVFRTYNASITLQKQLDELTDADSSIPEKLLSYNRANRAVAVLCNHQRSVPKTHAKSMETLKEKIRLKKEQVDEAEAELQILRKQAKRGSVKERVNADKKAKQLEKLKEQLKKLELQVTDKDENKTIALGTSKLNYLDPRISVAWCKKYGVPIEKIFNKTQREKFRWAIHMADENYRF